MARIQASGNPEYRQAWRVVDGAVRDCLTTHEDYLTKKGKRSARASIVKRVVGAQMRYAEGVRANSAKSRSESSSAAERGSDVTSVACGCLLVDGATTRTGRVLRALRTIISLGGS